MPHKLETFGFPRPLLARLSDYFPNRTQCTRMGSKMSKTLSTDSGMLQCAALSPQLSFTYIAGSSTNSLCHLLKYGCDVAPSKTISSNDDIQSLSNNLCSTVDFSMQASLYLNACKHFEYLSSFFRSAIFSNALFIRAEILTRVDSMKYQWSLLITISGTLLTFPPVKRIFKGCHFKSERFDNTNWNKHHLQICIPGWFSKPSLLFCYFCRFPAYKHQFSTAYLSYH